MNGKTYADDSALAIGGLNTSPNAIQFLFYNGLVISDTNALLKLRTFGYAIHANPGDHTGTDYTNFALAGFSIGVLTKMKVLSVADTCYDL